MWICLFNKIFTGRRTRSRTVLRGMGTDVIESLPQPCVLVWVLAEPRSETKIWVQVFIPEEIARDTGRGSKTEKRRNQKRCIITSSYRHGKLDLLPPGSSEILCRLCTSITRSRREGAGTFIQLPLVPALISGCHAREQHGLWQHEEPPGKETQVLAIKS